MKPLSTIGCGSNNNTYPCKCLVISTTYNPNSTSHPKGLVFLMQEIYTKIITSGKELSDED